MPATDPGGLCISRRPPQLHAQPTRKFVTTEEIGALAVFLSTEAAQSITGTALVTGEFKGAITALPGEHDQERMHALPKAARKYRPTPNTQSRNFDASAEIERLVAEFVVGETTPDRRSLKTRHLAGLAALTALKATSQQLKILVYAASAAGATREEVTATIVEAALYSGFAAARAGMEAVVAIYGGPNQSTG